MSCQFADNEFNQGTWVTNGNELISWGIIWSPYQKPYSQSPRLLSRNDLAFCMLKLFQLWHVSAPMFEPSDVLWLQCDTCMLDMNGRNSCSGCLSWNIYFILIWENPAVHSIFVGTVFFTHPVCTICFWICFISRHLQDWSDCCSSVHRNSDVWLLLTKQVHVGTLLFVQ